MNYKPQLPESMKKIDPIFDVAFLGKKKKKKKKAKRTTEEKEEDDAYAEGESGIGEFRATSDRKRTTTRRHTTTYGESDGGVPWMAETDTDADEKRCEVVAIFHGGNESSTDVADDTVELPSKKSGLRQGIQPLTVTDQLQHDLIIISIGLHHTTLV